MNNKAFLCSAMAGLLIMFATSANSATIERFFNGNDCAGYFGTGFDACTIFIDEGGNHIELSPVIAKYDVDEDTGAITTETNGTVFPSIDGSEFSFSGDATGSWSYTPGTDDPGVRFWATKAGNGFNLFWEVSDAAAAGVCNVADPYTLACLSEALVISAGDWTTPDSKGLSHITFYDSEDPTIVPIPAAVWLFGSGLIGLAGVARKCRSV